MQLEDSTDKPPKFVRRDDGSYNIWVIHSNGESYYESIHFEQIKEFFVLEHVLRQQEYPEKIPMGYDTFCQAFERDTIQRGITHLSFSTILYEGVEPKDALTTKHTQLPTIQEVLGSDADLRNEWERMESRHIM